MGHLGKRSTVQAFWLVRVSCLEIAAIVKKQGIAKHLSLSNRGSENIANPLTTSPWKCMTAAAARHQFRTDPRLPDRLVGREEHPMGSLPVLCRVPFPFLQIKHQRVIVGIRNFGDERFS